MKNIKALKQTIMKILESIGLKEIDGWSYEGCEECYYLDVLNESMVIKFNKLCDESNVDIAIDSIVQEAEEYGFIHINIKREKIDLLFKVTIQITL